LLGHAFSARIFQQIGFSGHDHLSRAQTFAVDGQFTAKAVFGVGPDTGAAGIVAIRHQIEAGRAGASSLGHAAAVADGIVGHAASEGS
jgi:ABC-type branched-subunit amino acid transport system permease subunit